MRGNLSAYQKHMEGRMKASIIVSTFALFASPYLFAQSLQFCVYNKYGQKQGGCYLDKKACENVVTTYNKTNGGMGFFCQAEKK